MPRSDQTEGPDHPYFHPLQDPLLEGLAAHLYLRWQEHEAVVAEWTNRAPLPWTGLEPDTQRGYRAIAVAASEFLESATANKTQPLDRGGKWTSSI